VNRKISIVIGVAALLMVCVIVWAALPNRRVDQTQTLSDRAAKEGWLFIKGLRYKTYENGSLVARVEAQEFKIIPRRFFVFHIKSLNEAVITNAKMDLFFHGREAHNSIAEEGNDESPFKVLFKELTRKDSGAGLITKVTMKGIDISIYDSGVLRRRVRAASADLINDSGRAIFYDATLEDPHMGKSVSAPKVVWDSHEKRFKVPGDHRASALRMKRDGKERLAGFNFHMGELKVM
jgi:hypothetical protein